MNFIDQSVLNFFENTRVEWLSFVILVITYCGSYIVVSGLTFLSAISFYIHKHTARILPLLAAVGGSAATTFILKNIFFRARPLGALYLETGSSFPSGHATAAIALYGFLLYTIWSHSTLPSHEASDGHSKASWDKDWLHKILAVFLSVLIILVGISRLYLGVHYLSDILVGYAIGLIWLLLSIKLHKYILRFFGRLGSY